jgi:hypothetical protein
MNEDYRMTVLQDRRDRLSDVDHTDEDGPEVDEEDDFDYAEWSAWLERHRAWVNNNRNF